MGDASKPSDDATWTDTEHSFFASAPPDEPQTLAGVPCFDDLEVPGPQRPIVVWTRRTAGAAVAGLAAARAIWRADQQRVAFAFALMGAIAVTQLSAGVVALAGGAPAKEAAAQAAPPPPADARAPRAEISSPPPRAHRTTWARAGRSGPARSSRPMFSR